MTADDIEYDGWDGPEGIAPRATVIIVPGRGETVGTYRRLGRRLAADAYLVRAVPADKPRDRVERLLADPLLPAPKILLGSDAGANWAAVIGSGLTGVDGLVLAGLVGDAVAAEPSPPWTDELAARSGCPTHVRVISEDPAFARGALYSALPAEISASRLRPPDLPTLILQGEKDRISPPQLVFPRVLGQKQTRAFLVAGGRHDILNDVTHRSVAATIVLFLESLKQGSELPTLVHAVGGQR